MPTPFRLFALFAKYWQPGQVKTRLAASIGSDAASDLYRQFLAELVARYRAAGDRRWLVFSPADAESQFRSAFESAANWEFRPQATGDLGTRMEAFFQTAFQAGADRVVLIGSDSPDLPNDFVEQAFVELERRPVVLGPAEDGGYYLIGLNGECRGARPPIFSGMTWSTPDVLSQTEARLQAAGIPWARLPQWYDVDDEASLRRWQEGRTA